MMFSSKAEEHVDKKDMVSNVFMCRKPFLCVGFYSVPLFSSYNIFYLFIRASNRSFLQLLIRQIRGMVLVIIV